MAGDWKILIDRFELHDVDEALRLVENIRLRIEERKDHEGRMWCIQAEEALTELRDKHVLVVEDGEKRFGA